MSDSEIQSVFSRLMQVIEERKANPPERSYTNVLLNGGVARIGEKILEEAHEVVDAAAETDGDARSHLVHESADLLYHLFVMLAFREIQLADVEAELSDRFGVSGLDEKASRHDKK